MKNTIFILCGIYIFSGCVSYEPEPIDVQEVSRKILKELNPPEIKNSAFDFKQAAELMSSNNSTLKGLKSKYNSALELAKLKTPIPNPELTTGLDKGFRLSDTSAGSIQPFISLAFTVPLSGKLSLQDDLRVIQAERERFELITKHRNLFMELREKFVEYSIKNGYREKQRNILNLMKKMLSGSEKLLESGYYSSLDVQRIELDTLNQSSIVLELDASILSEKSSLEKIISKQLPDLSLEQARETNFAIPDLENLWVKLNKCNPDLRRILVDYRLAEKKLELEIRKQYPDLKIGTGAYQDVGERKRVISFSAGLDLPIFDRNQIGIKKAENNRQELKLKYERVTAELRLNLISAIKTMEIETKHYEHYKNKVIPKMKALLKTAEKAVEAGELSISKYWDYKAQSLKMEKELFEKKSHLYQAVIKLENLIGKPLVKIFEFDNDLFSELEESK